MDDELDDQPSPLLDAVEAALSEIEGQPIPPFTVEVIHSCMAILAACGDYDPEVKIDGDVLVRATMRAFYCGFMASKSLSDRADLERLVKQD